ncbi:dUTP diphosphatase [Anaerofustis stercorihominis]|uniref:Deoxyuridine 5'-triphosphate nucleotidohydrolase n=1 Tax=Anaerofustis stercorihominis DSM 17244 TaxID=445971 RepID=B1C6D6_9FIRM|nr:dUTP diphosphatase [Anaerofustis stercorihominis]EDS73421.1 dUTP diphosphatase [Anaerofustis stercorihominis DSM 17244]MCQ4794943.1 dUTP diphosphatase [Anaerofustis stercorihominis]
MKNVKVEIINKSKYPLPEYATIGSAGADLYANIDEDMILRQGEISLIPTGIYIKLPVGYEAQIRARSGLSLKHGVTLVNGIGTIDSDYRGEIGIIITTLKNEPFRVTPGMKIAQMVISKHEIAEFTEVENLDETDRGKGGFGHSGV